jgi:hypothetical protein
MVISSYLDNFLISLNGSNVLRLYALLITVFWELAATLSLWHLGTNAVNDLPFEVGANCDASV